MYVHRYVYTYIYIKHKFHICVYIYIIFKKDMQPAGSPYIIKSCCFNFCFSNQKTLFHQMYILSFLKGKHFSQWALN
jgi:hypothetical protein